MFGIKIIPLSEALNVSLQMLLLMLGGAIEEDKYNDEVGDVWIGISEWKVFRGLTRITAPHKFDSRPDASQHHIFYNIQCKQYRHTLY